MEMEIKETYDGYFYSVKYVLVVIILGSLYDLQNFKQIHEWVITEHILAFLDKSPCFIEKILLEYKKIRFLKE